MMLIASVRQKATSAIAAQAGRRQCRFFFTPAFFKAVTRPSKIMFGNNSEHVGVERVLLNSLKAEQQHAAAALKALLICGGGDNYMSILADSSIESVTCVDASPHQLVLAQLKLAVACSNLTTRQALSFLGMNDSVNRLQVYKDLVEPNLSYDVAAMIRQDLTHEIETGIVHFGPGENCYRHLGNKLDEMGFPRESLWNGTVNLDAFHEACRNGIGTPQEMADASLIAETLPQEVVPLYLEALEGELFSRACMGLFRIVADGNCKNHISAMQILNYYDENSLPEWLLPQVRSILRDKQTQVTFVNAPLLEAPPSHYDLVSASNIFDWVSPQIAVESLDAIADKFLAPHGCILVRMGICSLDHVLNGVEKLKVCDKVQPEQLAEEDKVQVFFQRPDSFAALRHSFYS